MDYSISNYTSNFSPAHHNDTNFTDEAQREVYQFCANFMENNNLQSVIDVGCGSGYKLINILGHFNTVGIETEPCYTLLKNKYPSRIWLESGEKEQSFISHTGFDNPDVVICSDVIEHIVDPDQLVNYLLSLKAKYYIISTPCRKVLCSHPKFSAYYGTSWNGPPRNPCHVREWTMDEFKQYIGNKFTIISSHYGEQQLECQYHLLVTKDE